ncbi:Uncharacterized protein Rs2_01453 [Raphanus sativus]|nr:Uncharacterized protein Rs2_01453 [Raphanus sativus]
MTTEGPVKAEPVVKAGDWRTCLPPDSRKNNANKIKGTLKKHVPNCGKEGNKELEKIAASFEELIFNNAIDQVPPSTDCKPMNLVIASICLGSLGHVTSFHFSIYIYVQRKLLVLVSVSFSIRRSSQPSKALCSKSERRKPAMDNTNDWRTHLPFDSRQKIVNKILETLKKHLPYSGPEGINELKRIAVRFEEKIFSRAVNQNDYLRIISLKMLTMETKAQNAAGSSSNLALDNVMINNGNVKTSLLNEEPAINSGDWRAQVPPDSRHRIVNKIMGILMKHVTHSGTEGINELKGIAARFEEKVFRSAVNQTDYLRKISVKMLTIPPAPASSIPAESNKLALDELSNFMFNDNSVPSLPKEEPSVNSGDWRIQLPPDLRQKLVDKLKETLKKHVPYSGEEGIEELRRIAISFEELIFNTALNQVDYFRKISLKMQSMMEEDYD